VKAVSKNSATVNILLAILDLLQQRIRDNYSLLDVLNDYLAKVLRGDFESAPVTLSSALSPEALTILDLVCSRVLTDDRLKRHLKAFLTELSIGNPVKLDFASALDLTKKKEGRANPLKDDDSIIQLQARIVQLRKIVDSVKDSLDASFLTHLSPTQHGEEVSLTPTAPSSPKSLPSSTSTEFKESKQEKKSLKERFSRVIKIMKAAQAFSHLETDEKKQDTRSDAKEDKQTKTTNNKSVAANTPLEAAVTLLSEFCSRFLPEVSIDQV
jgi:hypothetical protein